MRDLTPNSKADGQTDGSGGTLPTEGHVGSLALTAHHQGHTSFSKAMFPRPPKLPRNSAIDGDQVLNRHTHGDSTHKHYTPLVIGKIDYYLPHQKAREEKLCLSQQIQEKQMTKLNVCL